jgi:hypothetical protein
MRLLFALLSTFILTTFLSGQVVTYEDFKSVIPLIQKENFKEAYKKTTELLNSTKNDSSDLRGIVTYMNIFSAAGMVAQDQMTISDFTNNANLYVGQRIVMSGHPCVDSTKNSFNSLTFLKKGGQLQGFTMAANSKKTNILSFEYFIFKLPVDPSVFIGKNVRCKGILANFEVNPSPLKTWITRLHISNADISIFIPN